MIIHEKKGEVNKKIRETVKKELTSTINRIIIKKSTTLRTRKEANIMLANLVAEMARNKVKRIDLANLLGVTNDTITNKVNEKTAFTTKEAYIIRDAFFPNKTVDYLFMSNMGEDQAS